MTAQLNLVSSTPAAPFNVGQGFCDRYGRAFIVKASPAETACRLLIGGPVPLARILWTFTVVRESSLAIVEMDEHTIARHRESGAPNDHPAPAQLLSDAELKRATDRAARSAAAIADEEQRAATKAELQRLTPPGAVAAIVAELQEDDCGTNDDYYNARTLRRVVIGWSTHTRDLFGEMRKAAATFPETADLATAPDSAEHREKWSMGGGYYLKAGNRYSTGWKVSKERIGEYFNPPGLEFSDAVRGIGAPASAPLPTESSSTGGRFTISEHTHTRKGFQMWIVQLAERVDRSEFDALLGAAKARRGWYSRPWNGTPGGFAFKVEAEALAFMAENGGGELTPPPGGGKAPAPSPVAPATPRPVANAADKLRTMADAMQSAIDDKFGDRLSNTPKRARQAAEARQDGVNLERAQKIMRALADAHDAGTVPPLLVGITTKAAILELAREACDHSRGGYYDAGIPLGKPASRDRAEQAAAAWALLDTATDASRAADEELRRKLEALRFAKIPGYFPTPAPLVARMIEAARLVDGARVLEPSAGSGAIADALKAEGFAVDCVESNYTLAGILEAKGHTVERGDFLERLEPDACGYYDGVVMNPPFENGADLAHVRHAFGFLKPGASLVAIMGAGVMFRQDSRYASFREWADELGGEFVEVPAGTFKESGTGVASVMLTLSR
jgi:predicted RNA methylase